MKRDNIMESGKKADDKNKSAKEKKSESWILRLYVGGVTAKSVMAFENLKTICEEELKGQYKIEVINLLKNPRLSREDQIIAVPTLVRRLPPPVKKIIGDLSNKQKVLIGLDLKQESK